MTLVGKTVPFVIVSKRVGNFRFLASQASIFRRMQETSLAI
jgi:hypothetical protein